MQVDFGSGARCKNHEGKWIKTYVFRSVLSHSRKGTSEAVTRMTVEKFLLVLENAFWRPRWSSKSCVIRQRFMRGEEC